LSLATFISGLRDLLNGNCGISFSWEVVFIPSPKVSVINLYNILVIIRV
jgi:hypothetical protein